MNDNIIPQQPAQTKGMRVGKIIDMGTFDGQVGGSHYKNLIIQPGIYCTLNKIGSLESNIIKYATRHNDAKGLEDIEKIIHQAKMIAAIQYGVEL